MAKTGNIAVPSGSDYYVVGAPREWTVSIWHGNSGEGKTFIPAMAAPEPVHIINFDGRAEPTVKKAIDAGRQVLLAHIPCPVGISKSEISKVRDLSKEAIEKFTRNFHTSLREAEKGNVRTIALDTGTELSEIAHVAITGQFEPVKGDYGSSKGALNLFWRKLFIDARRTPVHLVILARTSELWSSNKPTGVFSPRGPSVMEEGVDFAAQVRKVTRGKDVRFEVVMTNPKLDVSQTGQVYREDDWGDLGPFAYAAFLQGVDVL